MRKLKFLISVLLICCMAISAVSAEEIDNKETPDGLPAYAGSGILVGVPDAVMQQSKLYTDVSDTNLYNKLPLLNALEIITPDEDAMFYPEEKMTRAQAVRFILPAVNANVDLTEIDLPFLDVPSNSEYAPYITLAYKMGVIKGYGSAAFRPDSVVTGSEFIVMMMNLMGYVPMTDVKGGFISGYLLTASEIGMNVSSYVGKSEITRADAAEILYEALNSPVLRVSEVVNGDVQYNHNKKTGTMLAVYHDVYYTRGQVSATPVTSIGSATATNKTIVINNERYLTGGENFNNLLGYTVKCFYRQPESEETKTAVCCFKDDKTKEIAIAAESNPKISGNKLSYLDGDKRRTVTINPVNTVIRNGKRVTESYGNDIFEITDGTMKLVSSEGTDNYDIIFIDSYTNIVVESVGIKDTILTIIPKFNVPPIEIDIADPDVIIECSDIMGNIIPVQSERLELYDADGKLQVTYMAPAIPVGCVLSIYADKFDNAGKVPVPAEDATYFRMIASTDAVEGTVEAKQSNPDAYVIDNTAYKEAKYNFLYEEGQELEFGVKSKFLKDFNAHLVATSSIIDTGEQYVYLINSSTSGVIGGKFEAKLLLKDGTVKIFKGASSIEINDGITKDMQKVQKQVEDSAVHSNGENSRLGLSQVAKVKFNENEEITYLETLASADVGEYDDNTLSREVKNGAYTMKTTQKYILMEGGDVGPRYGAPEVFFRVPGEYSEKDEDYGVGAGLKSTEQRKTMDLYDIKSAGLVPSVSVIYEAVSAERIGWFVAVMNVEYVLDEAGLPVKQMTGCTGREIVTYTEKVSGAFDGLKCGDLVILYGVNTQVASVTKLYDMKTLPDINTINKRTNGKTALCEVDEKAPENWSLKEDVAKIYYFEPYKQADRFFTLTRGPVKENGKNMRQLEKMVYWTADTGAMTHGAILIELNGDEKPKIKIGSMGDVKLAATYGNEKASRVFCVETYADLKQLVIINGLETVKNNQ